MGSITPVTNSRGVRIKGLFLRGGKYYFKGQVRGKRYLRSIPHDTQGAAVGWVKDFRRAALAGAADAIRASRLRREVCSVGSILAAYEAAARRRGAPAPVTVRNNVWALRRILEVVRGPGDVDRLSADVLTGGLLRQCADRMIAAADTDSTRRTVAGYIRGARSLFARDMLVEYQSLALPDLGGFLRDFILAAPLVERAPYSQREVEIIRAGRGLRDTEPELYRVWALGYYCALRAGEIAQAAGAWLREHTITDAQRETATWIGDRRTVWLLDLSGPGLALKTAAAAGAVPLADDVAGELRGLAEGRPCILGPASLTDRLDLVRRTFSGWMRVQGWTRPHAAHELRAYRQQVWYDRYGEEIRSSWARHAPQGIRRHYVARLNLSRRPLGLEE